MKIIYRLDTDDGEKIKKFSEQINGHQEVVIPAIEEIKVYVISDDGKVTKLK